MQYPVRDWIGLAISSTVFFHGEENVRFPQIHTHVGSVQHPNSHFFSNCRSFCSHQLYIVYQHHDDLSLLLRSCPSANCSACRCCPNEQSRQQRSVSVPISIVFPSKRRSHGNAITGSFLKPQLADPCAVSYPYNGAHQPGRRRRRRRRR